MKEKTTDICGGHGRQFGVGVVGGRDLDDIGGDDVEAIQTPKDRAKFARGPAARLGRPRRRCEGRINRVDLSLPSSISARKREN